MAVEEAGPGKDLLLENGDDVGEKERPAACELAPVGRRQEVDCKDGALGPEEGERCRVALVGCEVEAGQRGGVGSAFRGLRGMQSQSGAHLSVKSGRLSADTLRAGECCGTL